MALTFVLSACGGSGASDPMTEPVPSKAPSASASPSPTPLPTTTAEAATLQIAELGSSVATTAEEKAVVEAWTTYWQAVAETYGEAKPASGLDSARGAALNAVLDYLDDLKAKDHRVVGWSRINVTRIEVRKDAATLRDCVDNFTFEVDQANKPVEEVTPYYDVLGSLEKKGGRWVVTGVRNKAIETSCKA